MNRGELRQQLRLRLDDVSGKKLWSDDELNFLINEAYQEACERSELLRGTEKRSFAYDADRLPVIISIPNAYKIDRVLADGQPLAPTAEFDLDRSSPNWQARRGNPVYFLPDRGGVRLHPTPMQAVAIEVQFVRIPDPLTSDADEPEIDNRYHLRMLDWALHLAYDKRDADAEAAQRSLLYSQKFENAFGIRLTARQQARRSDRRSHTVRPYGF